MATIPGRFINDAAFITDADIKTTAAIGIEKLEQKTEARYGIPFKLLFVHDAPQTPLPGTSASDDLGLYGTTHGTDGLLVRTYDVKNAGAVTLKARAEVALPAEFEDGETVKVRLHCGMVTTVASASATVDIAAHVNDKDGTVGSDLCTTAAQSINSLTFANKDFVITSTGLVAGDKLDILITIAVNDSATATAVIAAIGDIELLVDTRG